MTTTIALDESMLRDFASPTTDLTLLRQLAKAQTSKRLLMLAVIQRQLRDEMPHLADSTGFNEAYQVLRKLPSQHLAALLAFPSFGQWCRIATRFLSRQIHINLPEGQVSSHLGLLGHFALAGALKAGMSTELELRFNDLGAMPLPTWHSAIVGPLDFAGHLVSCRTEPGGWLNINHQDLPSQRFKVETSPQFVPASTNEFTLISVPLLAGRFELNDLDSLLKYVTKHQRPEQFEKLDVVARDRWTASVRQAWDLLEAIHPSYALQIAQSITVLVPLRSPSPTTHVSGSFPDTFGMIQMSWSEQAAKVAEVLVHEFHHNKLNLLLDLDPLVEDSVGAEAFYSPWKDSPRPLSGLLHGIFAFQSVVHFFRAYLDRGVADPAKREWAEQEYGRRLLQTLAGIEALQEQAELTSAGDIIVQEIYSRLRCLPKPNLPAASLDDVESALMEHRLRWQQAYTSGGSDKIALVEGAWQTVGGRSRQPPEPADPQILEFSDADQTAIGKMLGVENGIPINRFSSARVRVDPTLDNLAMMSVRDPEEFSILIERIKYDIGPTSPARRILGAHVAYIHGDWRQAVEGYAAGLEAAPDNLDTWRDFTFSLRHLNLTAEADQFLFQPQLVVTVVPRLILDHRILAQALGEQAELPDVTGFSESATLYLLWLRWLAGIL